MNLIINGEKKELSQSALNVSKLLEVERVESPDMVSVQLNGEFVNRDDFVNTAVNEGDSVDFLYFMGGGAR